MTLDVIAPAFYPDTSHIEYFLKSAIRHKIAVNLYGVTQPFTHWIDTHVNRCLKVLKDTAGSHVLFTDAADVIWLAGMNEIIGKSRDHRTSPVLISIEDSGPNFGGWMGERGAMMDVLQILAQMEGGDPQERLREAIRKDWLHVSFDYQRSIFQVMDGSDLEVVEGRIRNNNTGEWPCLLHFAGGYTDPVHGKRERMDSWMDLLGYV